MSARTLAETIADEALQKGEANANGVMLQTQQDSELLVISCSGIVPGQVIYAMENTTSVIPTNKLFICDRSSLWYYQGIPGLTTDFRSTVSLVRDIVAALAPKRVCTVGTSGGGYMALALGSLLGVDRILAMAPQTSLAPEWRAANGDMRWADNMEQIQRVAGAGGVFDIVPLLGENTAKTVCHVIYARGDALDRLHAMRIAGCAGVHVYELDTDDHNVAAALDRLGRLRALMTSFITLDRAALPEVIFGLTR